MWIIIKEELKYYNLIRMSFLIILLQLSIYLFFERNIQINPLLHIFFIILFFSVIIERDKIKIERQSLLFPLPKFFIGLSRTILYLIPWIIIIAGLYISNFVLLPSTLHQATTLIGQFSFVLILFFALILVQDIYQFDISSKKNIKYVSAMLAAILIILLTTAVIFLADYIDPKLQNTYGVIIIYLWGFTLSLMTIISFTKRKSYL